MYDICLISKLVELGEILNMYESEAESIRDIMSEQIGLEIMLFFKRYEELGIDNESNEIANALKVKKEMLHSILYDKALQYTFHIEVGQKGLIDYVKRINPNTLLLITEDKEKTVKDLEWLLVNEKSCIPALEVRRKEDFETFKEAMFRLTERASTSKETLGTKRCSNVENVINKNINYWYNRNEKKQYTGMHLVVDGVDKIKEAINGLKYDIICSKSDIAAYTRRLFF